MFFFPLSDDNPTHRQPLLSWMLIASCCLIFFWQWSLDGRMMAVIHNLGVVPAALLGTQPTAQNLPAWMTIFSSMFLHGGLLHLFGNMLFLWIFGDNVEDSIGRMKYLLFYGLCGVAAAFSQAVLNPNSLIPMIGASGAIAGVLGAYLLLYPFANIRCLLWVFIFVRIVHVPAYIVLIAWLVLQFVNLGQLDPDNGGGGVAYVAHIGGFLAGIGLIFFFKQPNIKLFARPHSRAFAVSPVQLWASRSPHLPRQKQADSYDNPWQD